jgi:DNA-binding FadR family transcriptional regulator
VRLSAIDNEILRFIVEKGYQPGDPLPTIQEVSAELGVSVAKTRESLEIARTLGILEIKPGRGTRVLDYDFGPAVTLSALYAIGQDSANFAHLRETRNALEIQFWPDALRTLTAEDIATLRTLIEVAERQLDRPPTQVPFTEHRDYHMTFFSRLDNPFVHGVLHAFWEAYEAFGLHLYRDLSYHRTVWSYHRRIVDAIEAGSIDGSRRLLIEHMNLLGKRADENGGKPVEAEPSGSFFE